MRDDSQRWDARYPGRAPGPARPPDGIDGIDVPVKGLCLDVASGLGEQSMWAAAHGLDVIALDASPVAIGALRAHAIDVIDARVHDLDDGLPDDVRRRCALVICQRFRDPRLYPQLVEALTPGGLLVITVLSEVGLDSLPGPFHAKAAELLDAFGSLDVDVVRSIEGRGEATLVARRRHSL